MQIKSPYNFIPAPEEESVCKPHWEAHQDIPVPGSLSGKIEFDIIAESPIFIRNSHQSGQDRKEKVIKFSHYMVDGKKQFFIPGSSLKGAIRNVVEIMSCSRLSMVDGIQENDKVAYGMRDMVNPQYSKAEIRNLKSGWLKKTDKGWIIQECEHHRIALTDIVAHFQLQSNARWARPLISYIDEEDKKERIPSAYEKANEIGNDIMGKWRTMYLLETKPLIINGKTISEDKIYAFKKGTAAFEGRLVVFGHMNNKQYEFLFGRPNGDDYPVEKRLVTNLLERDAEKELFDFYKSCNGGEIPVFFKLEKGKIRHFGFSKLYRLNNAGYLRDKKPFSSYPDSKSKDYEEDFAEKLFGHVHNSIGALRGRVLFTHAKAESASELLKNGKPFELVLNGPKPSYYPNYLLQDYEKVDGAFKAKGYYSTYHNADAVVRGFKRYPIHIDVKEQKEDIGTDAMVSKLVPLDKGAKFNGQIIYHNLTPVELGALLSALTFHGQNKGSFHTIGQGKPYGYGKVSVKLTLDDSQKAAVAAFELYMDVHCTDHGIGQWLQTEAMKELFAMSRLPRNKETDDLLIYPYLGEGRDNDFNSYKENGIVLEPYSVRNQEAGSFQSQVTAEIRITAEALLKNLELKTVIESPASSEPKSNPDNTRKGNILKELSTLKLKVSVGDATQSSKEIQKSRLLAEGPDFSNVKIRKDKALSSICNSLRNFRTLSEISDLRPSDVKKTLEIIQKAWAAQNPAKQKKWKWEKLSKYLSAEQISEIKAHLASLK